MSERAEKKSEDTDTEDSAAATVSSRELDDDCSDGRQNVATAYHHRSTTGLTCVILQAVTYLSVMTSVYTRRPQVFKSGVKLLSLLSSSLSGREMLPVRSWGQVPAAKQPRASAVYEYEYMREYSVQSDSTCHAARCLLN